MSATFLSDSRQTRRAFLSRAAGSIGSVSLAARLGQAALAAEADPGRIDPLHFSPKAKRVIILCQAGGPSQLETFDHKPKLAELHGKPMPESYTKGQPIAQLQGQKLNCFAPQFPFANYGQSGQNICTLFPAIGSVADEICIIRSMVTEAINHDPAHTFMNTGAIVPGRPAMGSWLLRGLGSEAEDLPGFVVLTSVGKGGQSQPIAARQWHSGFLPGRYQGVQFQSTGDPVAYVGNPKGVDRRKQSDVVDAINAMNALHGTTVDDPEIATRIAQNKLAFRMQASIPELVDFSDEPDEAFELYGTRGSDGSYAANCLLGERRKLHYRRAWFLRPDGDVIFG